MFLALPLGDQLKLFGLLLDLALQHDVILVGSPILPLVLDHIKKRAGKSS